MTKSWSSDSTRSGEAWHGRRSKSLVMSLDLAESISFLDSPKLAETRSQAL
jgi:hypothetical protein